MTMDYKASVLRRILLLILPVMIAAGVITACIPVRAENVPDAEWTVLIYLCGSDLESHDGMASYNLHEIMSCPQPVSTVKQNPETHAFENVSILPEVNVVIETGGSKKWHNDGENADWGLEIAADRLQRYTLSHEQNEEGFYPLVLQEEKPLASMGDADTLSDFIRWGTEHYPAQKTMLVLWDHGNGSFGMIADEIYDGDMLYLDELEHALEESGTHFEAVLLDACMMANLDTALILAPYAEWMIASEEVVSGYGTAFRQWMESLFQNPGCNGKLIGTVICDLTQAKYAEMEDDHAAMQITWSVIELKEIGRVAQTFDDLISFLCDMYEYAPEKLPECMIALIWKTDRFGTGRRFMMDLNSTLKSSATASLIDRDLLNALANALDYSVNYTVNGPLHSDACGLSFCLVGDMTVEERDIMARACRSAPYLALLDALTPYWRAPEWVYSQFRRLREVNLSDYLYSLPELVVEDGIPRIRGDRSKMALWNCYYELYRLDEDNSQWIRLGTDLAIMSEQDGGDSGVYEFMMDEPQKWPAIEGRLCDFEFVTMFEDAGADGNGRTILLYDVPIQIGPQQMNLRVGCWRETNARGEDRYVYKVYGISAGYSVSTGAPNRTVRPLALMQGQEYRLLYPILLQGQQQEHIQYSAGATATLYQSIVVKEIPLPPGTYACAFVLENCYFRKERTELVEFFWDGSSISVRQVPAGEA